MCDLFCPDKENSICVEILSCIVISGVIQTCYILVAALFLCWKNCDVISNVKAIVLYKS